MFALAASATAGYQGDPFHRTVLNIIAKISGFSVQVSGFKIDFFPDT